MDEDLDAMSREQLVAEARRLRVGIRSHRDASGQELCWHHPDLWALLPDQKDKDEVQASMTVPAWPQFMRGCIRYRQSLDDQAPDVPRTREEWRGL